MTAVPEDPDIGRVWREPDGLHLDVRGLECPDPMVQILNVIDRGEAGDVLIVHLDQEPLFLYPELTERGWLHELITPPAGPDAGRESEVQVRLVRANL